MKRYILTFLYLITLLGTPMVLVSAQATQPVIGEYVVLAPLPGTTVNCTGTNAGKDCSDINSYLSGFLGLVIGIGAVIAMIMLGFYGFQYALSDSASVKMANSAKLWEILQGLLLIISAYAIIYTINPALLKFSLEITEPKITAPAVNTTGNGALPGAAVVNDPTRGKYNANGVYYNDCGAGLADSCKKVADIPGVGVGGSGTAGSSVTTSFATQLEQINRGSPLTVTEAWPPTRTHGDGCHKDGTCVDAVLRNVSMTTSNVVKMITDARTSNAGAVFESNNLEAVNQVKAQLRAAGISESYALYLPTCGKTYTPGGCITGPHFSIYNNLKYR